MEEQLNLEKDPRRYHARVFLGEDWFLNFASIRTSLRPFLIAQ
jgi:hypothetical protein